MAIGTTLARAKGGPSVTATQTAKNVTVAKGATIAANATVNGDGGRVTVLSTGTTVMNGTITATGGATSGNGGFVETSGQMLGVGTSALIDVAAPAPTGIAGTWLLDPFDVAITGADSNTSQTGTTFTGSADPATIANTTLQTALAGGNVIISTTGSGKIDQGNITVSSTVTWTSANSLTLAADNNILINAAISASNGGLVLNAGTSTATGSITISAPVAAQSFSASTGVSGTINLDFNTSPVVTTSGGGQTYSNPVVLQANASVADSANGAIKFASTVDGTTAGAQGLTVGAGTGAVTFGAAVGGAQSLANLTVTGPTTLSGNITTTGTQTFNNAVTLAADATIATTNSAVDFAGTVDDTTAGGQALTVNAGTGAVTFGAVVGGTKSLASLTVTGPTTLTGSLTTTGPQTFDNAVTLAASTALTTTNAAIQLLGQVTGGAHSLLLSTGTGNQTLSGVTTSGNLALITTGIVTLDGGTYSITGGASPFVFPAITTNGALTLGQATSFGAVTLGSDTKFDSSAVNGAIDFTSTVDDTTAGGQSLTVNAGTGAVTFGAPVGGTKSLASLTVTSPTTLTGNITTTGTQTFDNAVTLAATSTLATTNSAVDFAGTVDAAAAGAQGLTVSAGTGAVTFGAAVGGAQSLANLTVTGPTTLAGNITTTGTQTFNSAVTLAADSTLATTNSAIDFASTVDATTVGTQGLTVNAGTGTVTFGAAVGGGRALASLTASGATTLSGNITTTGTQTFNNAVTLAADATIATTNSAVDFAGTVDDTTAGGQALTVNAGTGAVTFGAVVGGTKSLASLTVTGPTTLTGSLTTTGTQTFDNAVTLAASTALTTTNAAIQLLGQVTGGAHSLLLSTGTGNQTLSGVTTSGNLALITTGIVTLDGGTYSITGGASPFVFPAITTNGALTLGQATNFGAVTLGSDTKFDSSAVNGAVDFASTVDDTTAGGQTLTVSAGTGPVTFGAPVGGTNSLASLTVSGPTKLTGNITTTGTQTFDNAVTLAAPATLTTTNAAIQLLGQVTGGANSLSLSSGTGNQTLSGVTTSGNLALTTTGIVTLDGGTYSITGGAPPYVFPAVTTNGTLTLGQATNFGAVTLGSDTKFDSSAVDGAIDFTSTVDDTTAGGQALTVDAGTGAVTFGAPVGGGSKSLASLTVTGPTTLTGNITTTGTQTFDSAVTLAATSTLATTNGAVDFASTVDGTTAGGQALTVNAGTGPVKFGAPVGGTNSLASLTVTSPTTLTGNITTTGTQTFDNVVTLAAPTTLTTANAAIQLLGQVTGGAHSLLLSAGTGNQTLSGVTTSGNLALITTGIVTLDGGTYSITGGAPPYVFPAVTTNGTLMLGQATNFGAVTLGSDTKLDSTAVNAAVDFTSTVDGGFGLTVNVGSATLTFGSTVGGTNPLTTAIATGGSIVIGGAITAGALTLDSTGIGNGLAIDTTISTGALSLASAGAITESGVITATSLTGSAVGTVGLLGSNLIGSVGSFAVTGLGSSFSLTEATNEGLSVSGPLTASQDVVLNTSGTGGITVTGSIGAGPSLVAMAGSGGIQLNTGALLSAGVVDVDTTGGGGVKESGNGVIHGSTLLSSAGVTNTVTLGNANTINTVAPFTVTGGDFDLTDSGVTTLTVTGPLKAGNIAINGAPTISVIGSIGAAGVGSLAATTINLSTNAIVTGATVDLAAGSGGIALTSSASLGQTGGVVDLSAIGTGVSEAATATINGATLQSTGNVAGNVDLLGTANAIAGLGNFAVTGGVNHLAMLDAAPVTVNGTVTAPGQVYLRNSSAGGIAVTGKVAAGGLASFQTGELSNSGTIAGTSMEWAPISGTLTITSLGGIIPTNVFIGAVTVPGSPQATTASALVVGSNFGNTSTVLDLLSLGTISEFRRRGDYRCQPGWHRGHRRNKRGCLADQQQHGRHARRF